VKVVGEGIRQRLEQRQGAGNGDAAGQQVAQGEGHGEVDQRESQGLRQGGVFPEQGHAGNMGSSARACQSFVLLGVIGVSD
jgi:hypothetical protein